MNRFGFVRVSAATPRVALADPAGNAEETLRVLGTLEGSDVVVFPELGMTGYTCGDLFGQETLLRDAIAATRRVADGTRGRPGLVVVGLPLANGPRLFNVAAAITDGRVIGIVPKQFIPSYKEFYEGRWFRPATGREPGEVEFGGETVPFGVDLLFRAGGGLVVGIEVCEDLWMPIPPSASQAIAGANVLLNLSASNETIGKGRYRTDLVVGQSGRCIAAYAYSSSGPGESSTDLVFSGHDLIAENGRLLAESARVGDGSPIRRDSHTITADVDIERLDAERRAMSSFGEGRNPIGSYRTIRFAVADEMAGLNRTVVGTPFVPADGPERHDRCAEIFNIQCAGLAQRIERLPKGTPLQIGVSGGLDSTLALLVTVKACDLLGIDRSLIRGLTMPGFGTSDRTRTNALALMEGLGIGSETIPITQLALDAFQALDHSPFGTVDPLLDLDAFRLALSNVPHEQRADLTFENVQARIRTFLLMSRGFVVGTGDLSELALGWCTYNADHMSMYNPNGSIPKTLVAFLVRYAATDQFEPGPVRDALLSIADTTISPELLPIGPGGEILQSTEDVLGPYELHDFFLYHAIRGGSSPAKVLFLASHAAFTRPYPPHQIRSTLKTFLTRFFAQQFKRSCLPDGPKVGTVSLSPRGDWRMPSDASARAWLAEVDEA